ncbi:restriction endonuclease subunit S [Acetivibrio saccincola]|uniref:Type I restriction modification DNA specificity domain-containing protein n=1 Tax=Acetivibrio saccincola TaxID=1677857 RepID=A0A2S8R9I5_9FIRM|nr:restriction endonuclease subunit S [Acetivibrio saccincola]PQQ66449.1 hypothetical protein B9R14_06565 [Acetivibrio saccincola]
MTEWREQKLSDFMDFNPYTPLSKGIIAKKVTMEKLIPFNRKIQGYEDAVFSGGTKFKNGDTLVARITPCLENGKTAYVDFLNDEEVAFGSTEFIVLRAKEGISDSRFIFYFAISDEFRDTAIQLMSGTSGRQRVDTEALKRKVFTLPPLPEQKAIAEVLSSLDDKIDLLTRQNKTLEDLAQAYFRKWFIEDIHNKICYKRFADVAEFSKGKKPREIIEEQRKGYVRQILIDTFDTDKEYYTRPEGMIISTETDILMVMDGASSGRVEIGFSGVVGSTIGMFRPKSDFKYPMFLYEFLKSNEEFIMDNTTGSAIPHADKKLIFELEIPYFQEEKIQEFENFALVLFNKRQNNRRQIRTLTKLRDTLLPKLISGEIRVKM